MTDVFISYARKNRDRVEKVATGFETGGYDLWWDKALQAGDNYAMKIEKALGEAKSVVVCWSQQAKDSLWVRAEATEALDNDKLVQIKLDESRMPLPFNVLQMIPFDKWNGKRQSPEWSALESEVDAMTGRAAGGEAMTREPPKELKQRFQGLGPVAATGFALVLLTATIAALTILLGEEMVALGAFRSLSLAAFGAAALGALLVGRKFLRTAFATRQK